MFENVKHVVFFGCHTDDEMVCAGTLHRLRREGRRVSVVTFAPAATKNDRQGGAESVRVVEKEWVKSMQTIGASWSRFVGLTPSADLTPHRQDICQFVYDWCEEYRPDAAIVLSPEDENTMHALVGVECERVMRGRVSVTLRVHFPWNYGLGRPSMFVKLDQSDVDAKVACIQAYQSQAFRYAYREMLMDYCRADGLSVKAEWAEKLELVRAVV